MAVQGSMYGTFASPSLTVRLLLTLVASAFGTFTLAQDAWDVDPPNSVLVDSHDFSEVAPAEAGVTTADDTAYAVTPYGQQGCGAEGCTVDCLSCVDGAYPTGCCAPQNPFCGLHDKGNACWIARTDALILWRNAPPARPLVNTGLAGRPILNANGMDSEAAAGPRFSLYRFNTCNGTGWESTYLRAANWRSQRPLSAQSDAYALAPPGIYGNAGTGNFDVGNANLGASLQSYELNRHWGLSEHLRFLGGFRWVEWQEDFSLTTTANGVIPSQTDYYNTSSINSLYGGQIGLDALLLTLPWMRIDSLIKAGAYYNNGVQSSLSQSNATGSFVSQGVTINQSPVGCAFVGELGFTGVVPITSCLDFRFGYFGLWLSGLVQPTQQLSSQVLTQPAGGVAPTTGSINANGSTLVQGVSLGLEGRW
ncbi:MAG: BBP7 family outer membrane beta-barrel protein [Planctomycetia bacterium]|nr:BBP7 family outer membrane beta-barrel protein [Planctomycetia bacterium]